MVRSALLVLCISLSSPPSFSQSQNSDESVQAWFQARDGHFRTYEFQGRQRSQRDGLFIRVGAVEVELRVERVSANAWDCDWDGPPYEVEADQRVQGLRLVAVRGSHREVLLESSIEMNTAVSDEIIIHGSLGPYVSVERRSDYFAVCSAHGFAMRTYHWFDLRDGRQLDVDAQGRLNVELPSGYESQLVEREEYLWAEYRRALVASESSPDEWLQHGGPFGIVGIVPRLDGRRWRARVHVALGVPYAWSSTSAYQIETHFDVARLADWLPVPLTELPSAPLRFAQRHPRLRLGGVSSRAE